jgi:hypothetical protein
MSIYIGKTPKKDEIFFFYQGDTVTYSKSGSKDLNSGIWVSNKFIRLPGYDVKKSRILLTEKKYNIIKGSTICHIKGNKPAKKMKRRKPKIRIV